MVVLAARTTGVASKDQKPSVLPCGVRRDGFCEFCSNGKASGFRGFSRVLRLIGSVKFLGAGRADGRRGGGGEMHLRIGGVTSSPIMPE